MTLRTLAQLIQVVDDHQKPDCLLHKVDGKYVPVSSSQLIGRVRRLRQALRKLGVGPGDRVGLMAENGVHWPTVDFATLAAGAALVPVYPTLTPEQAAYIVRDSGSKVVFVQGRERFDGLLARRAEMPAAEHLVLIGGEAKGPGIGSFEDLLELGKDVDPVAFEKDLAIARPEDLATMIYTSGTTGDPKGVMLTHDNLVSNVLSGVDVLRIRKDHVALSFLPLSHSFERMVDYCYFLQGVTIAYAESIQTVAQNLQEVRPHLFVAVPRVYEKVQARALENAAKASPLKQKIFAWAVGVGKRALPDRLASRKPGGLLGLQLGLADKLVFSKIRERLGDRFEFAMSGGAPLSKDVAEFFWGAGIPIFEGYGLTETSPVISVNVFGRARLGTVGPILPGVKVKIAEDGEILCQGPNVMRGYWGKPEATAEVIDAEGWFHTGDIGVVDGDGFLAITDRKKELIVNAYGKNIAPAPIESSLKASRFISQAVVVGDRRQFLCALLVPDFEVLAPWAEKAGLTVRGADLLREPKVRSLFQKEIDTVNAELARYEQIRSWELLPAEFTIENGEITPTLKIKRRVINQRYGDILERLYGEAEAKAGNA